jgi:hypothetical protein
MPTAPQLAKLAPAGSLGKQHFHNLGKCEEIETFAAVESRARLITHPRQ